VLYGVYRRYNLSAAFLSAYGVLPPTLIAYFGMTQCAPDNVSNDPGGWPPEPPDTVPGLPGESGTQLPPSVMIGLIGMAMLGAVVALAMSTRSSDVAEAVEEEEDDPEMSAFARAAGRAADRIEHADAAVDNAVYRAWREMTALVAVDDPETTTPGEFAAAAVEVGMDETDVDELTRLFEEVRYGEADPETREDQAVSVFRRIEAEYGDGDADADLADGDDAVADDHGEDT
jgi:hypothetical protein